MFFIDPVQAKYIAEAEEKYGSLLKTLDPQMSTNYQRRCEEATKEGTLCALKWKLLWSYDSFFCWCDLFSIQLGGKMSGYPLGTWNIPPAIVDEELYRSNWLNSESVVPLGWLCGFKCKTRNMLSLPNLHRNTQ